MLPIHRSKFSVYNYEDIPAGYYYQVMKTGGAIQRFWHREKFREIANRIEDGQKVLDYGCGPGSFLDILGEEKPNVQAVGIDIASRQIEFAKQSIESKYPNGRIQFKLGDLSSDRLPFDDGSFDVFTLVEVIEHLHPYIVAKIIREAMRVLKPDGRIIITTPNYRSPWPFIEFALNAVSKVKYHDQHINKLTPNSLVKFAETMGLMVNRVDTIFIAAPFTAFLGQGFARALMAVEKASRIRLGSLLVLEATILDWDKAISEL